MSLLEKYKSIVTSTNALRATFVVIFVAFLLTLYELGMFFYIITPTIATQIDNGLDNAASKLKKNYPLRNKIKAPINQIGNTIITNINERTTDLLLIEQIKRNLIDNLGKVNKSFETITNSIIDVLNKNNINQNNINYIVKQLSTTNKSIIYILNFVRTTLIDKNVERIVYNKIDAEIEQLLTDDKTIDEQVGIILERNLIMKTPTTRTIITTKIKNEIKNSIKLSVKNIIQTKLLNNNISTTLINNIINDIEKTYKNTRDVIDIVATYIQDENIKQDIFDSIRLTNKNFTEYNEITIENLKYYQIDQQTIDAVVNDVHKKLRDTNKNVDNVLDATGSILKTFERREKILINKINNYTRVTSIILLLILIWIILSINSTLKSRNENIGLCVWLLTAITMSGILLFQYSFYLYGQKFSYLGTKGNEELLYYFSKKL